MSGWNRRPRRPAPASTRVAHHGRKLARGIAVIALFAAGCSRQPPPAATNAAVLRLSQRNEPADLDPARVTLPDEFAILRALSEGLLVPGANGAAPVPGAAERFDVSADGLTYTFHLRAHGRWSNGEPVTTGDFVASYQRLLTPATAAPKASVFYPVKNARAFVSGTLTDFSAVGFRAADEHTLVITLAQPTPRFPYYVASGPWLPINPRVIARFDRAWTKPENFVGNGPFTLAEWRSHQRLVVKKNPAWRDAARVQLAEIQFVRFDNDDTEERAYRAGQIDATMTVPKTKIDGYERERPAELHRAPMIETRFLAFNCQRAPLTDARVRRALALSLDRARIVEFVLHGGQPPAGRLVPPVLRADPSPAGASLADARGRRPAAPLPWEQTFAPVEARRLLADAGFANGKNFPRLELSAWSQSQTSVLEAIQAMWKQELGIDVAIAVRDAKVHMAALMAGTYDIGFIIAIPDVADAMDMLEHFTSDAPANYPQWHDARFDELIAASAQAADSVAQAATLDAAETRLIDAAAIAPVYFNLKLWLLSPRVHGWQEDGLWTRSYQAITLDEK